MKKFLRNLSFLLPLVFITCAGFAQKHYPAVSALIDSSLYASGKISLGLKGDFRLSQQQTVNGTLRLEFKSATDFLFARTWHRIDDSAAIKMVSDKKFLIENLFKTQPSPYPDVVSNQVNCPDHLKPSAFDTVHADVRVFAFRLYANDRFIYGECSDDVIVYTSAYILAYNTKEKTMTEIKYFTPKAAPVNIPEAVMRSVR